MKTVFLDFDTLHPADLDTRELDELLTSAEFWPDSSTEQLNERLQSAEVVVVNKVHLNRETIAAASALRLICLAATGSDNVDLDAASEQGIAVCNIRDYCTPSVIQHVFALILTLTQKLDAYRERVNSGEWQTSGQFCLLDPPIRELHNQTIGLIGLGALGNGVAGVARAFGMRVIAARLPWRTDAASDEDGQNPPRLPLRELLQQSDIVSLHCPLNTDTQHIIDAGALDQMRHDALLINTARGGLVDSLALVSALANNDIAGAGIDVLIEEPPTSGDPLLKAELPNLIVTPHIAWSAREARQRALDQVLANIVAFTRNEQLNRLC